MLTFRYIVNHIPECLWNQSMMAVEVNNQKQPTQPPYPPPPATAPPGLPGVAGGGEGYTSYASATEVNVV